MNIFLIRPALTCLLSLLLVYPAFASDVNDELTSIVSLTKRLDAQYAPNAIVTPEAAAMALQESDAAQLRLQAWVTQAESACHQKFFVNSCLSDVRVERRASLDILHRIATEAKALQRRVHIQQLDEALARKQSQ